MHGLCAGAIREHGEPFEGGPGRTYTLSAFDQNGIATGQMQTLQGITPLVVKQELPVGVRCRL
jgi:hypothetical protein